MRLGLLSPALFLVCSACFSSQAFNSEARGKVAKRAAFDLSCPVDRLEIVELDHTAYGSWEGAVTTIGVRGCDQRATYVRLPNFNRWVVDGDRTGAK